MIQTPLFYACTAQGNAFLWGVTTFSLPQTMLSLLSRLFAAVFLPLILAAGSSRAGEFTLTEETAGIRVMIDGKLFTKYITDDKTTNKPYFFPVIGPTGKGMTRSYPMADVEGEAQNFRGLSLSKISGACPSENFRGQNFRGLSLRLFTRPKKLAEQSVQ